MERFAAANSIDFELRARCCSLPAGCARHVTKTPSVWARPSSNSAPRRTRSATAEPAEPERPVQPTPKPAPAGSPQVLDQLKRVLEMLPREPVPPSHAIEPDQFHLRDDSPLRHEHELLSSLYTSVIGKTGYPNPHLENLEAGRTFLELPPTDLGRVVLAAAERHVNALLDVGRPQSTRRLAIAAHGRRCRSETPETRLRGRSGGDLRSAALLVDSPHASSARNRSRCGPLDSRGGQVCGRIAADRRRAVCLVGFIATPSFRGRRSASIPTR